MFPLSNCLRSELELWDSPLLFKAIILYMHTIKWFLKLLWWIRTKFGRRCWLKYCTKHTVKSWKLSAEVCAVLFCKRLLFQHLLFFLWLNVWSGVVFRLGTKMLHKLTEAFRSASVLQEKPTEEGQHKRGGV